MKALDFLLFEAKPETLKVISPLEIFETFKDTVCKNSEQQAATG